MVNTRTIRSLKTIGLLFTVCALAFYAFRVFTVCQGMR
jgi:hypothetical protein